MPLNRILLTAALIAAPVFAQAPRPKVYVTADQLNVSVLLPAPPAPDSPEGKAEMAEVLRVQEARTPAQIAAAKADDAEEDIFAFRNVLGPKFTAESLPLTAALSARVHANEGAVLGPAKAFFRHRRPFNVSSAVHPVCKTTGNIDDYGYPSGHSTSGWLEALVLVQMVPEKRNEILDRAADYAHNRVVCGVHFEGDALAAKSVGYATMGQMMNNEEFKRDLAAAKAETRALLGLR